MQKRITFLTLAAIAAITFLCSCKKDRDTRSDKITLFIYQTGTNTPLEGVTVDLYKYRQGCNIFSNSCPLDFYQSFTTSANGSFSADGHTMQIDFYKAGYLGYTSSQNWGSIYGPFSPSAIYYLDKTGWATFHITNPDAKKIDTVLVVPYSKLVTKLILGNDSVFARSTDNPVRLEINKYTDTTITSVAIAGAENYIYLQYESPDGLWSESVTDSFYVKDGDTAHLNIKIR